MKVGYEKSTMTTDEWYTPKEIINALGRFDLDPCAPENRLWDTARRHFTKADDGLTREWQGCVWLNPPYSQQPMKAFVKKLAEHGDGIALLHNRADTGLFHDVIFKKAAGIFFTRGRIRFYAPDGTLGQQPTVGSVLIAFGDKANEMLRNTALDGKYINLTPNEDEK